MRGECAAAVGFAWMLAAWLAQGLNASDLGRCMELLRRFVGVAVREIRLVWRALIKLLPVSNARERGAQVGLIEVSEMIDVIRLGLSAGLSFDAALELYCSHRTGRLPERMDQARLSWQMGLGSREEELDRAARDLSIRALESFSATVSQALSLGAPLSETLAGQSREIRLAHRARVEREIERMPVKLLIPTGTLILPALLLSIVGPLLAASGML